MGVFNTRPRFDDTQIKQLSGDTITLSGATNINGTFRYIPGATTGNFLRASDPQGTLEWAPISAVTWSISACTSPLYVTTIEACPNPTDPLYIEAGEVQFGTSPNSIITDITNTRVGIGTGVPSERLEVDGGNFLLKNSLDGRAAVTVENYNLGNDSFSSLRLCVSGSSLPLCSYAAISVYGPDASPTGSFGGVYVPNALNISTSNNTFSDRLHINIGSRRGSDAQTRFFGGGNSFDNTTLLGTFFTSGLTITDMVNTDTLRVRDGAATGYVLTSDSGGNATWQSLSATTSFWSETGAINEVLVDRKGENSYNVSGTSPGSIIAAGTGHTITDSKNSAFLGGYNNNISSINSSLFGSNIHVGGLGNTINGSTTLHYDNLILGGTINSNFSSRSSVMIGTSDSIMSGTVNSFIFGGGNHKGGSTGFGLTENENSGIVAGINNTFVRGVDRSVIIGGDGLSATTSDTVYVPNLNINTLGVGSSVNNLGIDSSGNVVTGTSGGGGAVTIDPYNNVGTTTTISWDVSGTSTNYEVTLNGAGTLNLTNVRNGDYGTLIVNQDGVGGHTLAFGTINGGAGTHRVVNGGGGAPTLTVNPNAIDILSFTYNSSAMYWTVGNDYT